MILHKLWSPLPELLKVKSNSIFEPLYNAYTHLDNLATYKCPKGCAECCKDFFLITEREYLYIAVYLLNHKTEDEIIKYTKKHQKLKRIFTLYIQNCNSNLSQP